MGGIGEQVSRRRIGVSWMYHVYFLLGPYNALAWYVALRSINNVRPGTVYTTNAFRGSGKARTACCVMLRIRQAFMSVAYTSGERE